MARVRRVLAEDVAYDSRGHPHEKWRYFRVLEGGTLLRPTQGVSPLPKGWRWKYPSRRKK
jgi:hypothetical protein